MALGLEPVLRVPGQPRSQNRLQNVITVAWNKSVAKISPSPSSLGAFLTERGLVAWRVPPVGSRVRSRLAEWLGQRRQLGFGSPCPGRACGTPGPAPGSLCPGPCPAEGAQALPEKQGGKSANGGDLVFWRGQKDPKSS